MEIAYRLTHPLELDVNLHVRGLTVLLGASGAGKTSLLRAIAGLLPASGVPFSDVPVHRRPVGYLPQHYALFPHLSAFENVCFPMKHVPREQRERRAMELLVSLGVAHCAMRRPSTLSGGEQQRVALARALARDPELLLLDEPLSAVDAPTAREIVGWLSQTVARLGVPALVATHSPLMVSSADSVAVLHSGRIVQHGVRDSVMSAPVSVPAARLLGYTNVLHGEVETGSAVRTTLGAVQFGRGIRVHAGDVCVAFRPESAWAVSPGAESPDASGTVIRARCAIQSVSHPYCTVSLNGLTVESLLSPRLMSSGIGRGEIVDVVVAIDALRILPAEGVQKRSVRTAEASSMSQKPSSSPR